MALETGTHIADLVVTNPTDSDLKSQGPGHFRLIKVALKTDFPAITSPVTVSHIELNYSAGLTGLIQAQFDATAGLNSPVFTGTPQVPTAIGGTNNNQAASTAYVVAAALSSSLPGQAGNAGKFISTDGTNASWATPPVVSVNGMTGAITDLVSAAGAQTLTDKRYTSRVLSTASSATPTINTDNCDVYKLTAQAVNITSFSTNLTGTPTDGQVLLIQITGTAARLITWGAAFEASSVPLPTATVTTAMLSVGFLYNAVTGKWRCVGVA